MSNLFRAASVVVVASFALALSGAGSALGAIAEPLPVIQPLPVPPVVEPSDAIMAPAPEASEPAIEPSAPATLAELVSRHATASTESRDMHCLAHAVYFESKGEPLAGQLAVAEVIINRAKSGRFADSICGVVFQPSQFSFVRNRGFPAVRSNAQWRQAVGVAHVALNTMHAGPAKNALFFHARRVSPNWNKKRVAAVGNHIFYR